MKQSFWIDGPLPGWNDILRAKGNTRFHAYNKLKKTWEMRIVGHLLEAGTKKMRGSVRLTYYWIERDRRRDPDNITGGVKFINDALVRKGIIQGDSQRWIKGMAHVFGEVSKVRPGVIVEIEEV